MKLMKTLRKIVFEARLDGQRRIEDLKILSIMGEVNFPQCFFRLVRFYFTMSFSATSCFSKFYALHQVPR